MKKFAAAFAAFLLAAAAAAFAACGGEEGGTEGGQVTLSLKEDRATLAEPGETYDLSAQLVLSPADTVVSYSSSDEAVASVSEAGLITAVGYGTASVTVTPEGGQAAEFSVVVGGFFGVYDGETYVQAMGTTFRLRLTLETDFTFSLWRDEMTVMGSVFPAETVDEGSYSLDGATASFAGAHYDFTAALSLSEGIWSAHGTFPTGGGSPTMTLTKNSTEDRGEAGTYTAAGEAGDTVMNFTLVLGNGSYTFTATAEDGIVTISAGTYSFSGDTVVFSATEGESFEAVYDGAGSISGTELPLPANPAGQTAISLTLEKQA